MEQLPYYAGFMQVFGGFSCSFFLQFQTNRETWENLPSNVMFVTSGWQFPVVSSHPVVSEAQSGTIVNPGP
jgi:hypothetical protein